MTSNSIIAGTILVPGLPINTVVLQWQNDDFKSSLEGLTSHTIKIFGKKTDIFGAGPWTTLGSGLTISPNLLSSDPYYAGLKLYGTPGITNARGGCCFCTLEYRGLSPSVSGGTSAAIYSLDRSVSNEPIQTHPKWISSIAGTPTTPLNAAQFKDTVSGGLNPNSGGSADANFNANTAIFNQWLYNQNANVGQQSIFLGVEDYLLAGQTWTSTYCSTSAPSSTDLGNVGFISTPDGTPPTPSGYQWIYLGCRYTDQAGAYRIDKSWKLFKTNAASTIIYTA